MLTIDDLPDDLLLEIFYSYVVRYQDGDFYGLVSGTRKTIRAIQSWQSLVHVCRRWRGLTFGSPRRLNLQLFYTSGISARKSLDVWPALPLLIQGGVSEMSVDNVVAELEHSDRIHQISLRCHTTSHLERLWTAMQIPFPELAHLYLTFQGWSESYVTVLPDSILDGSAPRLRHLNFTAIPFPGLSTLLLSATHLVSLWLDNIPHSGYISPEAMGTCLSMLTSLEIFVLRFESPQSTPDQESRRSPSLTRSVLPALVILNFKGANEYLEELVARIDTPRLDEGMVTLFNDIDLYAPELIQFISRSSTFKVPNEAHVSFESQTTSVKLKPQASSSKYIIVIILCREPDWQLSSLAQIWTTSSPLLSTTENLFISEPVNSQLDWKDGIANIEWLELLLPFTAVKNLYLSKKFALRLAPALLEMTGGGTTEVLPTLQNLYLEGFHASESVQEGIERFVSARQLTNRPIAISVWDRS